jgi:hypothetical protein
VVGKLYGRVLIKRISDVTESVIGEKQYGFRRCRGYVDQMSKKIIEKNKEVYLAFMDLEKAYDRIDRMALWEMLRMYSVGGRALRGVQSCKVVNGECVRGEWVAV